MTKTNEIAAEYSFEDRGDESQSGHRGLLNALKSAEWEAPGAPATLTVDGAAYVFDRHESDEAAKVDRYVYRPA